MMRVLIVALPHNPHSIRHANLLAEAGFEVHFLPIIPLPRHEDLAAPVIHHDHPTATAAQRPTSRLEQITGRTVPRIELSAARSAIRLGIDPSPWIRPNESHQSLTSYPRIKDISLRDAL
ncbi:MAG: hypothetical protein ACR2J8_09045, partial [Thermomicrobiales bacterium]